MATIDYERLSAEIATHLIEELDIEAAEVLEAISEGVRRGMWQMITSGTDMPCADFFDFMRKGVKEGIESVVDPDDLKIGG